MGWGRLKTAGGQLKTKHMDIILGCIPCILMRSQGYWSVLRWVYTILKIKGQCKKLKYSSFWLKNPTYFSRIVTTRPRVDQYMHPRVVPELPQSCPELSRVVQSCQELLRVTQSCDNRNQKKRGTDRRTDRRTDGPTDGRTDRQTHPLIEMQGRI